jgi:two-component system alkaline phosphatase synthesis response regulator PhoP
MERVLVIGLEKSDIKKFDEHLSDKGFLLVYCTHLWEAIGHFEASHIDLVIYQEKSGVSDLTESFNIIEAYLEKNRIPLFIVASLNEIGLVKQALELGVDNLIFKPFNFYCIETKIKTQIFKRKGRNYIDHEPFKHFFENNPNPLIVMKNKRILAVNTAFLDLNSANTIDYKGMKFAELFQFENDPFKYSQLKKVESGHLHSCIISKVEIKDIENISFDLFLVKDTSGLILTQLNVFKNNDSSKEKYNFYTSPSEKDSGTSEKFNESDLTKRELEVLKLSADGIPIKIIAQELKLSSRTVEKHRANIMQKFGAKNIIEVLKLL